MNDEGYERLLAVVTVLEQAVIEIGISLPPERRQALVMKMKELGRTTADGAYGSSLEETAARIAQGLSEMKAG